MTIFQSTDEGTTWQQLLSSYDLLPRELEFTRVRALSAAISREGNVYLSFRRLDTGNVYLFSPEDRTLTLRPIPEMSITIFDYGNGGS